MYTQLYKRINRGNIRTSRPSETGYIRNLKNNHEEFRDKRHTRKLRPTPVRGQRQLEVLRSLWSSSYTNFDLSISKGFYTCKEIWKMNLLPWYQRRNRHLVNQRPEILKWNNSSQVKYKRRTRINDVRITFGSGTERIWGVVSVVVTEGMTCSFQRRDSVNVPGGRTGETE